MIRDEGESGWCIFKSNSVKVSNFCHIKGWGCVRMKMLSHAGAVECESWTLRLPQVPDQKDEENIFANPTKTHSYCHALSRHHHRFLAVEYWWKLSRKLLHSPSSSLRGLEIIISQCSVDEMPSCSPLFEQKSLTSLPPVYFMTVSGEQEKKESKRAIILRKIQTPIFLGYDPWNSLT